MPLLTLLGVVHNDPRLPEALAKLKPDVLSVEYVDVKDHARRNKRVLAALDEAVDDLQKERVPVKDLERFRNVYRGQILLNDYTRCAEYARAHGIKLYSIDRPWQPRDWVEFIKAKFHQLVEDGELYKPRRFSAIYRMVARAYRGDARALDKLWDEIRNGDRFFERAKHMSYSIEGIMRYNPEKRICHVGGAGHFLEAKGSLYDLVQQFEPARVLVPDVF